MWRSVFFVAGALPFPTQENRGDVAKLTPSDIARAGVELAPLFLFSFSQVVQARLRLGGFSRKECGIVARRLFYYSAQESRVRLRFVGRPSRLLLVPGNAQTSRFGGSMTHFADRKASSPTDEYLIDASLASLAKTPAT
jgi:hypothetical protein